MTLLRDILERPGAVVDLGAGVYDLPDTVRLRGRTVTGSGAIIKLGPRTERDSPGIVIRGVGTRLIGNVTVQGSMPNGHGYDPDREAQHAIRVDGLVSGEIGGWTLKNVWGDGIEIGAEDKEWTHNLRVHDVSFDEIGRHAITADALDHGTIARLNVGRCNLSIMDIEPPGQAWGCKYLAFLDSDIHDSGGGFVLANKGVGSSTSVHDILLAGIRCHRRPFSVTVNPIPAPGEPVIRRQNFTIRNCSGAGVARQPQLLFRHVDGVTVENVTQEMKGADLVFANDCSNVTVTP